MANDVSVNRSHGFKHKTWHTSRSLFKWTIENVMYICFLWCRWWTTFYPLCTPFTQNMTQCLLLTVIITYFTSIPKLQTMLLAVFPVTFYFCNWKWLLGYIEKPYGDAIWASGVILPKITLNPNFLFNSLFDLTTKLITKQPVAGHLLGDSIRYQGVSSTNDQCPLLLTWFNFNPSMDK